MTFDRTAFIFGINAPARHLKMSNAASTKIAAKARNPDKKDYTTLEQRTFGAGLGATMAPSHLRWLSPDHAFKGIR